MVMGCAGPPALTTTALKRPVDEVVTVVALGPPVVEKVPPETDNVTDVPDSAVPEPGKERRPLTVAEVVMVGSPAIERVSCGVAVAPMAAVRSPSRAV